VILLLIQMNPGITQAELSRTNFRDKSSMSPIIREFVANGLVEQSSIKIGNRPAQALRLTAAGEDLLVRLKTFADLHSKKIQTILGDKRQAVLINLLRLLADGLSADEGQQ
jgi:DNA-binding MarR family transcriptional regulator